ncbi:MAG: acetyl-CoA acetyltransferase [Alphaproteobacteria bacterium]|nr:acetyl-CoA acetyltransferase [Alphaproteobacteria bacterium]MBV9061980.1 acetyl-CoA acetyltransferase [Alphaproteobacteria bacterium]
MRATLDPRTPILVGGGQFTQRTAREGKPQESLLPIEMLVKAARLALADSEVGEKLVREIDTVAVVRFTADSPGEQGRLPKRMFRNPPGAIAKHLGIVPRRTFYTATGGNTPQWLVNCTAEEIANGDCEAALLAGAEYLATWMAALKHGINLGWTEGVDTDTGDDPEEIGDARPGTSDYEQRYGLQFPVNTYPLFENAIRCKKGHTPEAHLKWLGEFFSPFSKVAAENPHAWFPKSRSPQEISTPAKNNRFVGFPYTKYLCAVIAVDMAAAVVMTSVGKARELGIPQSKWVFLHGCADANDLWHVTERVNYHSSPAIREMGKRAFAMANIQASDLRFIDLYSCFPSAVEIACAELGIAEDDPRGLTITGGLPYFGGPGNNYVMHSIVTMMEKLRAKPGAYGLCTGNGWYVTKHSVGIYSATPFEGPWQREDPKSYQRELDAVAHPQFIEQPNGRATVETYTVVTDRRGKRFGIVIGRDEQNCRFLAHTPNDEGSLDRMMREDILGRAGEVTAGTETNLFQFGR